MKKLIFTLGFIWASSILLFLAETKIYSFNSAEENSPMIENQAEGYECSDGWRITGYFTPIEADYDSAETREIEISGVGKLKFNSEFLDTVFNEDEGFGEGWGKTRFGWYLGNYGGAWHKSDAPLDASDAALNPNSVAVDNKVIPNNSVVRIPGLPEEFASKTFIASDVGVTVHGKHIDVYTGEGKDAERKMYKVTFEDDNLTRVCFKTP
ncbi:MAG TPA: 3D domain-containing protein [Pyrinomonadaceae bacterium]